MRVGKLSRNTTITRSFILLYARSGFGKTSSLLNIDWDSTVYISTETGFRVLQSLLQFIEDISITARKIGLEEAINKLKTERPSLSEQLLEIYIKAVEKRLEKPEDYLLEIDHIHIDSMNDLYNPMLIDTFDKKQVLNGIDMSKKDTLIIDTLTYYSDIVVKERKIANANNNNKFATWSEHSEAIKSLLEKLLITRGIKIVIGHEGYDKDLKKKTLALQGDAVKTDISGKFNIVLYGTELHDIETNKITRVFITNPDLLSEKVDAKSQDIRINEIEPMDLSIIINKLKQTKEN